jgi:hypothetical protein
MSSSPDMMKLKLGNVRGKLVCSCSGGPLVVEASGAGSNLKWWVVAVALVFVERVGGRQYTDCAECRTLEREEE